MLLKFDGETARSYTEVGHSVKPGDILEVTDEVAKRLLTDSRFSILKVKPEPKKTEEPKEDTVKREVSTE